MGDSPGFLSGNRGYRRAARRFVRLKFVGQILCVLSKKVRLQTKGAPPLNFSPWARHDINWTVIQSAKHLAVAF